MPTRAYMPTHARPSEARTRPARPLSVAERAVVLVAELAAELAMTGLRRCVSRQCLPSSNRAPTYGTTD